MITSISKRIKWKGLLFGFCICVSVIGYTVWDNHRIIIEEQEIVIDHLPEELDGFAILQITDLHEREFGKNQIKLLEAIRSIEYDAIVFTGDMLDAASSTNYKPFYTLIEGIENKEIALFVPGNTDPQIDPIDHVKNDFIKGMEQREVKWLESVYTTKIADSTVYFVNFEKSIMKYQNEIKRLSGMKDADILVALSHYPVIDEKIDTIKMDDYYQFRNYDLIIAGHYHGGQIRLPFIGALFVPEESYLWGGLFPPSDRVKGLWEYKKTKQYVSTGLGSSDAIPFMKFRFLNPPEINLLTFKKSNGE
ncbi:metallophosphoesterase [Cytobacillus sp.]|uniref:metallophosphoesterase n=1 Tax=Cytobacillus sp. TaxID=2675269 RepID=UPI0028BDB97B|nr:metallophosphoesterase [Cytobacillus sp.]